MPLSSFHDGQGGKNFSFQVASTLLWDAYWSLTVNPYYPFNPAPCCLMLQYPLCLFVPLSTVNCSLHPYQVRRMPLAFKGGIVLASKMTSSKVLQGWPLHCMVAVSPLFCCLGLPAYPISVLFAVGIVVAQVRELSELSFGFHCRMDGGG